MRILMVPIFVAAVLAAGCGQQMQVTSSGTPVIQQRPYDGSQYDAMEFCYQGTTYVRFGTGPTTWGSVKLKPDGRPVFRAEPSK